MAEDVKKSEKAWGRDSKTKDQKRIKTNCFHRGYVRRCAYFGILNRSRRWPTAGGEEKQKIVFFQPYKTPSESKKIENYLIVCWAGVGRFCC